MKAGAWRHALMGFMAITAGCAFTPQEKLAIEQAKPAGQKDLPQETLTIGLAKHLSLKEVGIEADLLLAEESDLFALGMTLKVDGTWDGFVAWDQKELSGRLLHDGGSEAKGFSREVEGLTWIGCMHGWSTKAILYFAKKEEDGRPRVLEIKVFNSHRLLRLEEP